MATKIRSDLVESSTSSADGASFRAEHVAPVAHNMSSWLGKNADVISSNFCDIIWCRLMSCFIMFHIYIYIFIHYNSSLIAGKVCKSPVQTCFCHIFGCGWFTKLSAPLEDAFLSSRAEHSPCIAGKGLRSFEPKCSVAMGCFSFTISFIFSLLWHLYGICYARSLSRSAIVPSNLRLPFYSAVLLHHSLSKPVSFCCLAAASSMFPLLSARSVLLMWRLARTKASSSVRMASNMYAAVALAWDRSSRFSQDIADSRSSSTSSTFKWG